MIEPNQSGVKTTGQMSLARAAGEGPNDDNKPVADHTIRQGRQQSLSGVQQVVALSTNDNNKSAATDDKVKRESTEWDRQKKHDHKSLKENMKTEEDNIEENEEGDEHEEAIEVIEERIKINCQSGKQESSSSISKTKMTSKQQQQQPEQLRQLAASLRTAANEGKVELVRLLLRCGADVNAQDEEVSKRFDNSVFIFHYRSIRFSFRPNRLGLKTSQVHSVSCFASSSHLASAYI